MKVCSDEAHNHDDRPLSPQHVQRSDSLSIALPPSLPPSLLAILPSLPARAGLAFDPACTLIRIASSYVWPVSEAWFAQCCPGGCGSVIVHAEVWTSIPVWPKEEAVKQHMALLLSKSSICRYKRQSAYQKPVDACRSSLLTVSTPTLGPCAAS